MRLSDMIGKLGSQAEVARRIGVSQPAVNGWIHGRSVPTGLALRALAEALGLGIEEVRALAEQACAARRAGIPIDTPAQTRQVLAERGLLTYAPSAPASVGPVADGSASAHAGNPAQAVPA